MEQDKLQEIREGIHDLIGDCLIKVGCSESGCPKAEALAEEAQEDAINNIIKFLANKGLALTKYKDGHIQVEYLRDLLKEDS